jgi:hypothetical protein
MPAMKTATPNTKEIAETLETLGQAAARLLQGMERRAKMTRPGVERTPRIALRLVAANDERRDREGCAPRPIPQFADREELVGVHEFDAMTSATGLDDDGA